jgi:hypothetical protein
MPDYFFKHHKPTDGRWPGYLTDRRDYRTGLVTILFDTDTDSQEPNPART